MTGKMVCCEGSRASSYLWVGASEALSFKSGQVLEEVAWRGCGIIPLGGAQYSVDRPWATWSPWLSAEQVLGHPEVPCVPDESRNSVLVSEIEMYPMWAGGRVVYLANHAPGKGSGLQSARECIIRTAILSDFTDSCCCWRSMANLNAKVQRV